MPVSVSQLASILNNRFDHLLISVDDALLFTSQKTDKESIMEGSEQAQARRQLLIIEEDAIKQRKLMSQQQEEFFQKIEAEFHTVLISDLAEKFDDTDYVLKKVLGYNLALGQLLDILYTESCSISRLEACVKQMEWLSQAVIRFVKQPKYRRFDSKGKLIVIENLRSALSFVGIESLRTLLPALIAKHSLPSKTELFPQLQQHMWEYTLGTGKACQAIAKTEGIKWYLGYNTGLLSTIGRNAITKIYLKYFDIKLREEVIIARKENNLVQAEALGNLIPSSKYLISLWQRYADQLTSNLVVELKCRWLMIGIGLEDYTQIKAMTITEVKEKKLHPLTNLLFRCRGYMHFKMMQENGLISKQAAIVYLKSRGIVSDNITLLKKTNLSGLSIKIAGIQEPARALKD